MPRLTKLSPEKAAPEARRTLEGFLKERGNIPNMFRTVAHRGEILTTMTAHFNTVMAKGTVERKLKEMISVRVSHINLCKY